MMPRTRISEDHLISDITGVSTGLVVEEDAASPDPFLFLCESAPTVYIHITTLMIVATCYVMYAGRASSAATATV